MSQPESSSIGSTRVLFETVMRGEWDEVIKLYKRGMWDEPTAPMTRLTRSGYTALHAAVSYGREDIVELLIKALEGYPKQVLAMQNEAGNTPLHIAASMGNVRMCKLFANVGPELMGIRNEDGETPPFLAALHGKKDAFLCLHSYFPHDNGGISYCRRNDGNSILHCAIAGEYLDLAFQIIHLYKDLVNCVNEKGLTPLHILATKPSAFESGSNLGRFQKMVYQILFVKKLKANETYQEKTIIKNEPNPSCPQNYQILVNFFHCVWHTLKGNVSCITSAQEERHTIENPTTTTKKEHEQKGDRSALETEGANFLPPNYVTCVDFVKVVYKAILIFIGPGYGGATNILDEKRKHTWSVQVLDELLRNMYENENTGQAPFPDGIYQHLILDESEEDGEKKVLDPKLHSQTTTKSDSPILIAAEHGIAEIVKKILEKFPVAINDTREDKKNIVLIAVENRQFRVYKLLLRKYGDNEGIFRKVDKDGNGALHLAARLTKEDPGWPIPGDALQMQWEIKWLKLVEKSKPKNFFVRYNSENETPDEIFTKSHQKLAVAGGKWLTNTSQSCSVVAGLFVTIAFTTSTTMPGGAKQDTGTPYLEREPAFDVFAISSMVTFYSSVIAVVMFLAILTSGYQMKEFEKSMPRKLLLGLTALYVSIASTLISFCTGHFFILRGQLKEAAAPVYSVICLLVTFFAIVEFPLYFQLVWATFKKVPQR